jgi:hypothetical protein
LFSAHSSSLVSCQTLCFLRIPKEKSQEQRGLVSEQARAHHHMLVCCSLDCAAHTPTLKLCSQVYEQNDDDQVVSSLSQTLLHAIVLRIDELHWEEELPTD